MQAVSPTTKGPYSALGEYVRRVRSHRGLNQGELAVKAKMRPAQLSGLENGANVEIKFYDRVARAMDYRGALEMFTSGGDEKTRKLLRLWRALPDEEARTEVLRLVQDVIVADEEPGATSSGATPTATQLGRTKKGK